MTDQKPMTGADYRALFEEHDEQFAWKQLQSRVVAVRHDPAFDRQYPKGQREARASLPGDRGLLIGYSNAHGLTFKVRAPDGYYEAYFEPEELSDAPLYSTWSCPGCKAELFEVIARLHVEDNQHLQTLLVIQCANCGFVTDPFNVERRGDLSPMNRLKGAVLGDALARLGAARGGGLVLHAPPAPEPDPTPAVVAPEPVRTCDECAHHSRTPVHEFGWCSSLNAPLAGYKICGSFLLKPKNASVAR